MKNPSMKCFPMLAAGLALAAVVVASPAAGQTTYYRVQGSPQQGTYTTPYQSAYPSTGGYYPQAGQSWYYDYYGQAPPSRTMHRGEGIGAEMSALRGEVLRTKRVEDRNGTCLAALLETDDGRRVVVDLGRLSDLRNDDLSIHRGQEVGVRGWYTNIGDHRVFMAHELRAEGQRIVISRPSQPSQERLREEEGLRARAGRHGGGEEQSGEEGSRSGGGSLVRQYFGQIVRTSEVKVPELNDRLMFAQIRTDQGNKVLAMLGPVGELRDLDLRKGERVYVKGICLSLEGTPFILTEQFKAQGQTFQGGPQAHEELLRRSETIKGKVVRTRDIDLPGLEHEVLVAVVKGEDGHRYVVGLGTNQELGNMEINKGDQVSIRGPVFEFEGQRVLLGRQVTAHGQTVQLGEEGNRRD